MVLDLSPSDAKFAWAALRFGYAGACYNSEHCTMIKGRLVDLLKVEMRKPTSPLYNRNYAAAVMKPGSTGSVNVADPKAKAKTNPKRKAKAKAKRENEHLCSQKRRLRRSQKRKLLPREPLTCSRTRRKRRWAEALRPQPQPFQSCFKLSGCFAPARLCEFSGCSGPSSTAGCSGLGSYTTAPRRPSCYG